jgi:hypothetical protein
MSDIIWEMDRDTAEKYLQIVAEFENQEISEEEYADLMMSLPGYPLPGLPSVGATLRIVIRPAKPMIQVYH